jgi:predicted branched-subunit amino acid permease
MSAPPASAAATSQQEFDQHDPAAWRAGMTDVFPMLLGIGAWGLVVGVAMVKSGLTAWQATGMTLLAYAGSAQLATLPLIVAHAPLWVIFLTAAVVNLRFIIFSALLGPHFPHLPWKQRLLLGYISGDATSALFSQRYPDLAPVKGKLSYMKGLMYPNWIVWQVTSLAGILLGSAVPAEWGLGFAGTLALLCLMVPLVFNSAAAWGVAVAGAIGVIGYGWPYKLGLLLAVVVGMLVAMTADELLQNRKMRRG